MRTAVLLGFVTVGCAIDKNVIQGCEWFYAILTSLFLGMDVYDFLKHNNK